MKTFLPLIVLAAGVAMSRLPRGVRREAAGERMLREPVPRFNMTPIRIR